MHPEFPWERKEEMCRGRKQLKGECNHVNYVCVDEVR